MCPQGSKGGCHGLRTIYSSATEEGALQAVEQLGAEWDGRYSMIGRSMESLSTEIVTYTIDA
ncbi:MAG TPA: hypothetical protein VMV68_02710, partial [Spirochaetia bacterium]|nr:hypothetical protein [Spirochaetia bacterium]